MCKFLTLLTVLALLTQAPIALAMVKQSSQPQLKRKKQSGKPEGKFSIPVKEPSLCNICKIYNLNEINNPENTRKVYLIDARPGYLINEVPYKEKDPPLKQARKFKVKDKVNVFIINMNPFLYDYTVKLNEKAISETALFAFLGQFSPLFGGITPGEEKPNGNFFRAEVHSITLTELSTEPAKPKIEIKDCPPDFINIYKEWDGRLADLTVKLNIFSSKLTANDTAYSDSKKNYHLLLDPIATCEQLCEYARDFEKSYRMLPDDFDLDELRETMQGQEIKDITAGLKKLKEDIQTFRMYFTKCSYKRDEKDLLAELSDKADSTFKQASRLPKKAKNLDLNLCRNRVKLASMMSAIEFVQRHPETLAKQLVIGDYDINATVAIDVQHAPRGEDKISIVDGDCKQEEKPPAKTEKTSLQNDQQLPLPQQANHNSMMARANFIRQVSFKPLSVNLLRTEDKKDTGNSSGSVSGNMSGDSSSGGGSNNSTAELEFGSSVFSVSGGIGISPLKKREFQPVPMSGEMSTSKNMMVGFKENSNVRVLPMLLLNIRETENGFLHGTIGITAKRDNDSIDVEYLLGQSVRFYQRKIFLTVGAYIGRQQTLAGDLKVGSALPEGITAVPIRKKFEAHIGFALSFKIK
jgi:hypothetical protein